MAALEARLKEKARGLGFDRIGISPAENGEAGERLKPQVVLALRETLSVHAREDGVWAPSSTWFTTARNPDRDKDKH